MKIYTGKGDRGKTSLFSGERIAKSDRRIAAYGDVDELNSILGMLIAVMPEELAECRHTVAGIQSDLFHVGAWLATTPDAAAATRLKPFDGERAAALEAAIDHMDEKLPPLTQFVLPGGHLSAAWAHIARTVCRRAERLAVARLAEAPDGEEVLAPVLTYLNRLSDYLFVLARFCNYTLGIAESRWET